MYDPHSLLSSLDKHPVPILSLFAAAMILQTIAMVSAVRVQSQEKAISIPLFCTFFWFAHDFGYVVRFHEWFVTYDHWFLKAFWIGLFSAMILELFFFAQAIKYGRKEYLPNGTTQQWGLIVAVGAVASIIGWEWFKYLADDPLYQAAASLTLFALPLTGASQIMKRRSFVAQTPVIWGSFAAMVPFWWGVTIGYFGGGFRSWQYISLGVVTFLMFAAMTVVVARGRARAAVLEPPIGLSAPAHHA